MKCARHNLNSNNRYTGNGGNLPCSGIAFDCILHIHNQNCSSAGTGDTYFGNLDQSTDLAILQKKV